MRIKEDLTGEQFAELTRPKLKLFLSADVVGSTAFKQQHAEKGMQEWLSVFLGFFAGFPNFLRAELANEDEQLDARLWKSLGDELIFTAELKQRAHAGAYLRAMRRAIQSAEANWKEATRTRDLLVKGSAWLAGFPVGNAEIPLESFDSKNVDGRDYIGPLVDTGFRLKEHATPRKFVLSADLAYLLISVGDSRVDLFFDGDQPLKGVLRSRPYPIVWVDCSNSGAGTIHSLKDNLLGRKKVEPQVLRQYLQLWFKECEGRLPLPFIHSDQFEEFSAPSDYENRLERAVKELAEQLMRREENDSATESSAIPQGLQKFLKS